MEVFLIRALQLILCFSILILLHEGGHFLFAKLFKVRVEKFCLFFDPWFTLAKFKPRRSDTTYALGWLPLGGYVKIAGMIDESMDREQMKQPVKPWEFRAKPAWQRLLIMVGGVLVNFLLAFFIYAMILFTWGDTYTPIENMKHGFKFNETAQQLGFRDGDIPLRTDVGSFDRFDSSQSIGDVYRDISNARSVTVLRDGKEVTFALPGGLNLLDMMKEQPPFLYPLAPALVDSVVPGSPADKAGIRPGDRMTAYAGTPVTTSNEVSDLRGRMNDVLAAGKPADSLALRNVTVAVQHAGSNRVDSLRLQLGENYMMGLVWYNPWSDYEQRTVSYGFFESFPAGAVHGWNVLSGYVDDLKYLATKEGAQSVGSFGAIGSLFPTAWNWERFWELTAFISLILAFMNILPIPALDGGHVFFLLYEVVTRRKPSDRFMEVAQMVGMTLLLLLMAYAIFNDFVHFVF